MRVTDPEEWHRDFFWPVSHSETQRINGDFKKFHCALINRTGNTFEGDCLLIAYHISSRLIEVVNHYLSLQRLESKNYHVVPSSRLKLIPLLQKNNEPVEFSHAGLIEANYSSRVSLRNNVNSLKFNLAKGTFSLHGQFNGNIHSIASAGVLCHEYVHGSRDWIKIISSGYLLDKDFHDLSVLPKGSSGTLEVMAEEFVKFTSDYASRNLDIRLPVNILDGLHMFVKGYLLKIACAYSTLLEKTSHMKIYSFLSSTAGSPYNRALSLAISKNGGKVTGFPHGFFICHHSGNRPGFHEFATVDQFATYTPRSISLFKKNIETNPLPRGHSISFVSDNTSFFKDLHESWDGRALSDKIKTVMILELSMIPEWAGYYAAEAMVNYHFYYSLCRTLSKNGYKVIFKRRPKDLSWDGYNIFEKIPNVEVIHEHFEDPGVIDRCDAVIMQYGYSSTLNWSMCTNKTVIYTDAGWEPWFPEVYDLMSRRCRVLHCSYDERNRAVFKEDELLSILGKKPGPPDSQYAIKYLYPQD
ncbi:MAG TPA: hypothetical protein DCZ94_09325 [Lentisphaeria bacterium]|nr:MAG: hypothetical protein A2X48_18320 [Lentisphaerae bacterium GWF2_49_21]HBC87141.1 hypothetical protein [Lentisphaeria bacterium]